MPSLADHPTALHADAPDAVSHDDVIQAWRAELLGGYVPLPQFSEIFGHGDRTTYNKIARLNLTVVRIDGMPHLSPREAVEKERQVKERERAAPAPVRELPPPRPVGRPRKVPAAK